MPIVTLQLGQCGNQLGCAFFDSLAAELSTTIDHERHAADEFFRPIPSSSQSDQYCARAVLIDMEPKVVHAVTSKPHSGGWWRYSARGSLCMQSGSGNNWAHGFHGYGPTVKDKILELVRREVEACDSLGRLVFSHTALTYSDLDDFTRWLLSSPVHGRGDRGWAGDLCSSCPP